MRTYDLHELFEDSEGDEFKLPFDDLRWQFPDPEHRSEHQFGPDFAQWIPEKIADSHGWDMSGTYRAATMVTFTRRKPKA